MAFTLCTSGQAVNKAGIGASSTIKVSGQPLANWSDDTESYISSLVGKDVVTGFSGFKAEGKLILQRLSSNLIAQEIVGFDSAGFNNQRDFETKLDLLENNIDKDTKLLKDDKLRSYLGIT